MRNLFGMGLFLAVVLVLALYGCSQPAPPPAGATDNAAPPPDAAPAAAPTGAPAAVAGPLLSAEGTAKRNGLELALHTACAVWHRREQTLRVTLYPFELTDDERNQVIGGADIEALRKVKPNPNPDVWSTSKPHAEILLRFKAGAPKLDLSNIEDLRMGFTDFDAEPTVSASQVYVRPETEYLQSLSVSGTAEGDTAQLSFVTPAGKDQRGAITVRVDTVIVKVQ